MQITKKKIDELKPANYNPRKNLKPGDKEYEKLKKSIKEFGYVEPVIYNKRTGIVVGGHQRLKVLKDLGYEEIDCVIVDLDEAKEKALNIALNKISGEWNNNLLADLLKELDQEGFDVTLTGFDLDEAKELFGKGSLENVHEDNFNPEKEVKEIKEPKTKAGDIYHLGDHRIICGDSTNVEYYKKVLDGERIDLVVTDPPYNIDYGGTISGNGRDIANDNMSDSEFYEFLLGFYKACFEVIKEGGPIYVFHSTKETVNFINAMIDAGFKYAQTLVWYKNHFTLGRQDYQWIHEPCQPKGTMVRTPNGEVPIEDLKDGDRVISFDTNSGSVKGFKNGYEIRTASREYDGNLYSIFVGDKVTKATDNHKFSIKFANTKRTTYCTYLMKKGDWWRVGITETYNSRGFGVKQRLRQELGEDCWILETYKNKIEAQRAEQLISVKYGIPYTHWETDRFITTKCQTRTKTDIKWIYDNLNLEQLNINAIKCLNDFGRNIKYPFINKQNQKHHLSCRITSKIEACNLIPEIMLVPVPYDKYHNDKSFEYKPIDKVQYETYKGTVYSLAVEKFEHYISDGIVTHNCLYGWKEGAAHYFINDRTIATVIEELRLNGKKMSKNELLEILNKITGLETTVILDNKPNKSVEHPTMKPITLCAKLIYNSSHEGDIVFDSFLGSGSTLIACEQLNRRCYGIELEPKYIDVIVKRYKEINPTAKIKHFRNGILLND